MGDKLKIETTDTFRGTLGVRASKGEKIVWAGYVFPLLNPKTGEQDWAVDAYVGTMEPECFLNEIEVTEEKDKVISSLKDYLGSPTFDVVDLQEKLQSREF
jgi:hypothetical protein